MLIKTITQKNKTIQLFNKPIIGSEKIIMNNRVFYMMIEKTGLKINRHKPNNSIITSKVCGNCGIKKSVDYFSSNCGSNDGYNQRCKTCMDTINKKYHEETVCV